jgi:aryl-alcohol dehydrogenase-like predicted oxidoreductase
VSALGFGCWAIGGPFWAQGRPLGWGEVDDEESARAIHHAFDLGVTFFDTANVYGAGHSERILGRTLASRRDEVVIATKFGNLSDEKTRETTGVDATPQGVRRQLADSLRRLGTDYIDLYQLHLNDFPVVAALELVPVLDDLVARGDIRAYGWSTDNPDRATAFAMASHGVTAIQHDFSVLRDSADVLNVCERFDLASIDRGPLAMGLLTGKYTADSRLGDDDVRGISPDWMRYFQDGRPAPEFLDKLDAVREVLRSGGRTLAQGAIGYLWGRSDRTIPIPGCRTVAQARENAGALAFGPLTKDQVAEVDRLLGRVPPAVGRQRRRRPTKKATNATRAPS